MNCIQRCGCQNTICFKMLKHKLYVFLLFCGCELWICKCVQGTRDRAADWGTALRTGRSQVRFGVIRIFNWRNSYGRTVALESAQPLTEMSVGKDGRCVVLTTLPPLCAYRLEIWEPQTPGLLFLEVAKFNVGKNDECLVWQFHKVYVCMHICMYACAHVVCVYACAHARTHTHTHTHMAVSTLDSKFLEWIFEGKSGGGELWCSES
jgi:hypothetical protein